MGGDTREPILSVRDLRVSFRTENGLARAVDGVSFDVRPGEVLGIVGESGSGKSVTAMSLMRLVRDPNATTGGQVIYRGRDITQCSPAELQQIRGSAISMIFQDPMSSLNPVYSVGWQIEEQLHAHQTLSRREARQRAIELLRDVGIPSPEARVHDYPHQFSGGMRQRVMIAMALSCQPDLLIADEPTTALDVTIQAQILDLILELKRERERAVILITHDMGVVAQVADRVLVMYGGRVVEEGTREEIFYDPQHPYSWGLLGSIPRLDQPKTERLTAIPGQPPSPLEPPSGCSFRPRCRYAFGRCAQEVPALRAGISGGHLDACLLTVQEKRDRRDEVLLPPRATAGIR